MHCSSCCRYGRFRSAAGGLARYGWIEWGGAYERGTTAVEVGEVVVVIGNEEMALVFGAIAVGVANERAFPVVVEVVVRDGDEVTGVRDVEETREGQRCVLDGRGWGNYPS